MKTAEFMNAIGAINKKRAELFGTPICHTETYIALCTHPGTCVDEKEKELLATLDQLDEHLRYNNYDLLLQVKDSEHTKFIETANGLLNRIEDLAKAIDWGRI